MRRFGVNKKNPNPPWPNEQPVVAVPPGVSASAVGMHGELVRSMPTEENNSSKITVEDRDIIPENEGFYDNERETEAGYIPEKEKIKEDFFDAGAENTSQHINMKMSLNAENAFDGRENPIMGYIPETSMRSSDARGGGLTGVTSNQCTAAAVGGYLCGQTGRLVKVEFLFGENTHIEKTGILKNVGKDFIVLAETGTNNSVVCSMRNIKFINIYNYKEALS